MVRFLIIIVLSVCSMVTYSQPDCTIIIEKRPCGSQGGFKLFISIKTNDSILQSNTFYDLKGFNKLDDTIKLLVVEELLAYESDTSVCCLKVSGYVHNYIDGCKGSPKSKSYNIQIDALFMINRICFSNLTDLYSCHPVLFDTKTKKEINNDPEKIKCVYREYRKWYEECKVNKKISEYFPFNDGRYVWYGGRKSIVPKE